MNIGDQRPPGTEGPAGDQRPAGESGPAGDQRPPGDDTPAVEDPGPPERSALKADWENYADLHGYNPDEGLTKDQLIERYGD